MAGSSSIIASSTQEPSSAIVTPSVNPLAISFSPDTPSVTPAALSTTTSTTNTPLNTSSSTTVFVQTQAQAATTSIVPTTTQAETPSTTAAAPTQSQASSSSSSSSGTSQSDIDQYLNDQNTVRAQHGASAFTWNNTLADAAQKWANGCVFQHSGGTLGPYGENLAAGTGSSYGISAAITSWTSEVSQYNANDPVASHFTQVVWKASTEVGCAVQDCSGIFPASFGLAQYYVCEYFPQGNVIGEFA
ncbi:hypothetical protein POSPLADRAFT_1127431 [Postia placenta MAD-698-R-SB12]|uniref:SCP domain-containing protein n=1 Tax=Postia placenta MAD-698-R-SB12 TaxID=670580 RepID=A0A1X6NG77_9APHY|nr:hypothetical protein POSPLADRAFT_1127431 [Postia placenta MAD-698-R-SB12]OSX67641.1 hypothetical protein POSPLADRAFT_1127431 [Postia placenta MAD-698-R-SB12]